MSIDRSRLRLTKAGAALALPLAMVGATIPSSLAAANDVSWISPRGGLYQVGSNWNSGSPPSAFDRAVFQLSGAYSVLFDGPVASGGLLVSAGQVTFDLGRFGFTSNGNVEVVLPGTSLSLLGDYTQTAGRFDLAGASMNVAGAFNYTGGEGQDFLIRGTGFSVGDVAASSVVAGYFQVSDNNAAAFNDVTVLGGAAIVGDSSLSLLGDYTQTAGRFDLAGASMNVAGAFNYTGGEGQDFLIRGTGFSVGDVAASSVVAGYFQVSDNNAAAFNDVTVLGGAAIVGDSSLSLLGDYTQTAGRFDLAGASMNVAGAFNYTGGEGQDFLIRGTGFSVGDVATSSVVAGYFQVSDNNAAAFNDVTVLGGAAIVGDSSLSLLGDYTQTAGRFDLAGASMNVAGAFNYTGAEGQDFLIRGTGFSVGDVAASSVVAGYFQVSDNNAAAFNDVTVLGGAAIAGDSSLSLLGDYTQTAGRFDLAGASMNVAGAFNYTGAEGQDFLIRGTGFSVGDVAASSVVAGYFQVSDNNAAAFNDVTVLGGAAIAGDSSLSLLGDYTQTAGLFDVNGTSSITVGGTFSHTAGTAWIRGQQFTAHAATFGGDGSLCDVLVQGSAPATVATTLALGEQAIVNVAIGGRLHVGNVVSAAPQPEVRVGGGGTLLGDGQVNGNVVVEAGGAVSPAPGVGSLTVAGSYTALDAAGLSIDLGSASPQPQLAIGGTAQLDGTITVTFEPGYDVARGELVTLISAGEISGAFDVVNVPSGYDLVYGTNTVSIKRSSAVIALSVQLESSEIPVGFGTQVAAVASYADGTTADVTAMTTWSSTAPSIASVNAAGVVLGLSPGLASIEGAFGGFDEAATLSVSAIPRDWATSRVSVNASGTEGNGPSVSSLYFPSLSSDGRLVCIEGTSTNLVLGDTNGFYDVFVKDLESGLVELVSVATDGTQANGASYASNMSDDGRFVAFTSDATNLSPADGAPNRDIYLRDRQTGVTTCITCSVPGADNQYGVLSGDGRYILLTTTAAHDPTDTNGLLDLYRFDRILGTFQLVSRGVGNTAANGVSVGTANAISRTGRFVNFRSTATNLVSSDTNGRLDVFLADLDTGSLELVSVGPGGVQSDGDSLESSISDDGRYVAFLSFGSNLTEATDTNGQRDGFVRDRVTGENVRVSDAPDGSLGNGIVGSLSMTPDGRYVAFRSASTNLLAGDRNAVSEVFRREVATGTLDWVSEALTGFANGESSFGTDMTPDGGLIVFGSLATNLVPFDQNGVGDVFARELPVRVAGDLDGDDDVDGADLGALLGAWGTGDPSADLDGSGTVDGADLAIILGAWQ